MKESTNHASALSKQQRIELELMHAVLDEDAPYPWNPADSTSRALLDQQVADFAPGDLSSEDFVSQWGTVSQLAAQLWSDQPATLVAALVQEFGSRMPTQLLTQLAERAQAVSQSGLSLIDQLVESAQTALEGWEADDLQVMARPLALSMRGGQEEMLDVVLQSVRQTDWQNLSELEQARLSLAIARYALGELSQAEGEE
jgi:hypothetical protein